MTIRVWGWVGVLVVAGCLALALAGPAAGEPGPEPGPPPHVQVLEARQAPQTARLLREMVLTYMPGMTAQERDRDMLQKAAQAKRLLRGGKLVELRRECLAIINSRKQEPSWEFLRRQKWPGGEPVGVTLSVPVWVPAGAQKVPTFCGFEKRWQVVAQTRPRPSGFVWFVPLLAQVNNKANYRPQRLEFEINSRFASFAALFLEYIFREGWYEPHKRVPLLVVRGGEDTYAAAARSGPVTAECLSFPDDEGTSLEARVALCRFANMADLYHGRHSPSSNHRLGLALDVNDFNFAGVTDGPPNPISRASRQYHRDAMHRLDARQLPAWVFQAAKWLGFRLPQEWIYFGYHTDWAHFDVGTK